MGGRERLAKGRSEEAGGEEDTRWRTEHAVKVRVRRRREMDSTGE